MNTSLEPVLRHDNTDGFNEKGFSGHRVFFTFCLKKVDFLAGEGMNPLFALIREVSPKKVSFFYALPKGRGRSFVLLSYHYSNLPVKTTNF